MSVCDTLFLPLESGVLKPAADSRALFFGARAHKLAAGFGSSLECIQYFKPHADELVAAGYNVSQATSDPGAYDFAFVLAPKNRAEAQYHLALAWQALKPGGALMCATDNKAGGTRLERMLADLGLAGVHGLSKHKARVAWGLKTDAPGQAEAWLEAGGVQAVMGGAFWSQPGLFGWDKFDEGSRLLLDHMPALEGNGADFGCGYGALGEAVLTRTGERTLTCIDADARALECARRNLCDERVSFLWADLTKPAPGLAGLDFIVMNPPFHEGKNESAEIGQKFIASAAQALKTGGDLVMVANSHLPYEMMLRGHFAAVDKLHEGKGFKVFAAKR